MITKIVIGVLIAVQLVAMGIMLFTLGLSFLLFPTSVELLISWKVTFAVPLAMAWLSQIIIGILVFLSARRKIWASTVKCDLWGSLYRSSYQIYNFLPYATPLFTTIYFFMIIVDDCEDNWWKTKRRNSFFFRCMTGTRFLSLLQLMWVSCLWILFGSILIFAIGGALQSDALSLLSIKLWGLFFLVLFPGAILFKFMVDVHMLSREWADNSFGIYLKKIPCRWPHTDWINASAYYRDIMRNEDDIITNRSTRQAG